MFVPYRFCVLVFIWAAAFVATLAWTADARGIRRATRSSTNALPRWRVTETANFRIYSYGKQPLDSKVVNECEALRSAIAREWFGADADQVWEPKCDLVLHGDVAGYRAAVGKLAHCTVASCVIESNGEKTVLRRIDVRGDCPRWIDHLPHELTHMLSDGRMTSDQLPPWIDEGMALLADPASKRAAPAPTTLTPWITLTCSWRTNSK